MTIKKGQALRIRHQRQGFWRATAAEDFDTETTEWYPLLLDQDELGGGKWYRGERPPARRELCTVTVI